MSHPCIINLTFKRLKLYFIFIKTPVAYKSLSSPAQRIYPSLAHFHYKHLTHCPGTVIGLCVPQHNNRLMIMGHLHMAFHEGPHVCDDKLTEAWGWGNNNAVLGSSCTRLLTLGKQVFPEITHFRVWTELTSSAPMIKAICLHFALCVNANNYEKFIVCPAMGLLCAMKILVILSRLCLHCFHPDNVFFLLLFSNFLPAV